MEKRSDEEQEYFNQTHRGKLLFYGYTLDFNKKVGYDRVNINRKKHYEIIKYTYLEGLMRMRQRFGYLGMYSLYDLFARYDLLSSVRRRGRETLEVDRDRLKLFLEHCGNIAFVGSSNTLIKRRMDSYNE